ncbi:MAG: hypothetical protein AAF441_19815 [Pseudomonadota bacterium]
MNAIRFNRRNGLAAAIAALVICSPAIKANAQEIEWELAYPFRFFHGDPSAGDKKKFSARVRNAKDWGFIRDLYVDAGCIENDRPVACSEGKLGAGRIDSLEALFKRKDNNHGLIEDFVSLTRYSPTRETHKAHIIPEHEEIPGKRRYRPAMVRLNGAEKGWTCSWSVTDQPDPPAAETATPAVRQQNPKKDKGKSIGVQKASGGCREWAHVYLLTAPDPGTQKKSSTIRVDVETHAGKFSKTLAGEDTRIKSATILGIGDSFASGEGNPDLPVSLDYGSEACRRDSRYCDPVRPKPGNSKKAIEENRKNAASWLDRNCHRSMMGGQMRAALHFSAKYPQIETIFIGMACSGATIREGILGPYAGTPETSVYTRQMYDAKEHHQADKAQLDAIIETLCKSAGSKTVRLMADTIYKMQFHRAYPDASRRYADVANPPKHPCANGDLHRKVDAVLLSIGGNDVGFANVVAYILLGTVERRIAELSGQAISPEKANEAISKKLPDEFKKLRRELDRRLGWKKKDAKKLVVSLYPSPTRDQDGKFCNGKAGLSRFDALRSSSWSKRLFGWSEPEFTKEEAESVETSVVKPLNDAIRASAVEFGWTVADTHLEHAKKAGICAEGRHNELEPQRSVWNPYAKTATKFRSPNDSYHLQNLLLHDHEIKRQQIKAFSLVGNLFKTWGVIHPNNFGAADLADAYLLRLEELLAHKTRSR